jgi:hypothetical protein
MRTLQLSTASCLCAALAAAQATLNLAGNAKHTTVYLPAPQDLDRIRWFTTIDRNPAAFAHRGAPLITAANTVIVPVTIATTDYDQRV